MGGVWRDNTYPGCACDIPAPLYSYSFAPNPDWSRRFPPRSEILAYLERCVADFGLTDAIRFGVAVTGAQWAGSHWQIACADGTSMTADILIPAMGQLSRPAVPDLPGAGTFAGPRLHTARWDPELDVAGRRVGVIGTGASAIQLVPAIAGTAAHVTVFQRTPPWLLPKPDRRYGPITQSIVPARTGDRAGVARRHLGPDRHHRTSVARRPDRALGGRRCGACAVAPTRARTTRGDHARLPIRLQTRAVQPRLAADAAPARRHARHRGDSGGQPVRGTHRRRRPARLRHPRVRHWLSRHRVPRAAARDRRRRGATRRRLGRGRARLPRPGRGRLPEHVPDVRPEHEHGQHLCHLLP